VTTKMVTPINNKLPLLELFSKKILEPPKQAYQDNVENGQTK
jgi:hypothetical protein